MTECDNSSVSRSVPIDIEGERSVFRHHEIAWKFQKTPRAKKHLKVLVFAMVARIEHEWRAQSESLARCKRTNRSRALFDEEMLRNTERHDAHRVFRNAEIIAQVGHCGAGVCATITGAPAAMPSKTDNPNPSYEDGCTAAAHPA